MFFSSVLNIPIKEYLPDSYIVHMYLTMCRGSISVKYNNLYNTSPTEMVQAFCMLKKSWQIFYSKLKYTYSTFVSA